MKTQHPQTYKSNNGFTLVEMLMVMIISSILLTSLIMVYDQYRQKRMTLTTKENIKSLSGKIALFSAMQTRYPCPADAALSISNPNFGEEVDPSCNIATLGLDVNAVSIGNPDCTPNGGICLALSPRKIDFDNDPSTPNDYPGLSLADHDNTFIIIGAAPVKALEAIIQQNTPIELALDGHGNKYTYAVALNLTKSSADTPPEPGTYKYDEGNIAAIDEFNKPTAGMRNAAGEDDAHYVLISHGRDGKGAFGAQGTQITPCGTTAQANDNENCNGDGAFMKALGSSLNNNADFYDDYTYFSKIASEPLWEYIYIPNSSGDGHEPTPDIQSLNIGNVGIGTPTPRTALEVARDPLLDDGDGDLDDCVEDNLGSTSSGTCGIIKAHNNVHATRICDKSKSFATLDADGKPIPTDCFRIDIFTQGMTSGEGNRCPEGQIMNGFKENGTALNCVDPAGVTTIIPKDCGAGYWVAGIDTNGNIICTDELDEINQ